MSSGYTPPLDSASTLTIWLGRINVNASLTGTSLELGTASGNGWASLSATADVGDIVQIVGAGPGGAPLWTVITAVASVHHATVADAATANVTGQQCAVYQPLDEETYNSVNYVENGSISFKKSITTRPTLNFSIYSGDRSIVPIVGGWLSPVNFVGMPVLMTDASLTTAPFGGEIGDVFGGSIEQAKVSNYPGQQWIRIECECVSWDAIIGHRVLGLSPAFPQATSPEDFNGGQIQTGWSPVYGTQRWLNFSLPPPVAVISLSVDSGPDQTIGPYSAMTPVGAGGFSWYWQQGGIQIFEDPSGPDYTDADSIYIETQAVNPVVPYITFSQMSADAIVLALIAYISGSEGISIANVVSGPIVNQINFTADMTLDAAISSLCTYINDGTTDYWAYIDPRKGFHFEILGVSASAPWNIQESDDSDGNVLVQVSNAITREKFANAAWIDSNQVLQAITQVLFGNNSVQSFQVIFPIASKPTILFGAGLPANNPPQVPPAPYTFGGHTYPEAQTVGSVGETGYDWYWQAGSNVITQETGNPPLQDTEAIWVTYTPQIGIIQAYPPFAQIPDTSMQQRQLIEGGSGEYDVTISLTSQLPFVQGVPAQTATASVAQAIAQYFSNLAQEVDVETYRNGLAPGMSILVNLGGIANGTQAIPYVYVVQSVELTDENKLQLWRVTCIAGATIGDWLTAIKYFTGGTSLGGNMGGAVTANTGPGWNVIAWTSTIAPDYSTGGIQECELQADTTVTDWTNLPSGDGQVVYLVVRQPSAGGCKITWGSAYSSGSPAVGPPQPSQAPYAETTYVFGQTPSPGILRLLAYYATM